ncbi:hypothetical protein [Herbaspirillum lusitanum]|uniref:hypothetical protein n=1 Tax=Herbaspirillum lusitanum TaxID=213312 RepID=UPI000381D968|nr:hypothetical protein [Herbaspirillum lusitanum]
MQTAWLKSKAEEGAAAIVEHILRRAVGQKHDEHMTIQSCGRQVFLSMCSA